MLHSIGLICSSNEMLIPCVRIKKLGKSEPMLLHDGERIKEIGLDA